MIENDDQNDHHFYSQHGVKLLSIRQASTQILKNFERHGIALTSLKKRSNEELKIFNRLENLLKDIESGVFIKKLNAFKSNLKNSPDQKTLVKKHQLLLNIFKLHIDPKKQLLLNYLKDLNCKQLVIDIFFLNKNSEELYSELNDTLSTKLEEFRNMIFQIHKALNIISEIAYKINEEVSKNENNITE